MSIDAIENNQAVKDPQNRIGRVRVTRRERLLIDQGKLLEVSTLYPSGHRATHPLADLTLVNTCRYPHCNQEATHEIYCSEHEDITP